MIIYNDTSLCNDCSCHQFLVTAILCGETLETARDQASVTSVLCEQVLVIAVPYDRMIKGCVTSVLHEQTLGTVVPCDWQTLA